MHNRQVLVTLNDDGETVLSETELLVLGDKHTISSTRILRDTGEMIAPVTIARTGIMLYKAKELGDLFKDRDPESLVRVMTKPEVLFDQATIDSCRSIPLTIGHPKDDVDISNSKELQKGFLEGVPVPDGSSLAGHVVLNDRAAVALVDSGIDQVSLGHKSKLVRVDNNPDYDCEKTTITANHIAIVRRGRAQTTRIGDDGSEVAIIDRAAFDTVEAERDALKDKLAVSEQKLADALQTRLSDEDLDKMVDSRVKARLALLVDVARLGDEFSSMDFTGKSEIEIKRDVVTKIRGDISNKNDSYVDAAFDLALQDSGEITLSDALSTSLSAPEEKPAKKVSVRDEALARRNERYK